MKRVLTSFLAMSLVVGALAQSNFTIVRPADGAKIRETVRILFPMNSVPDPGGYIGIYIGGKFLEAVKPKKGQQYLYYELDTKDRGIPDGPITIEAVLYQDFADRPRIVDRSSVQLNVQNSASIKIPEDGLSLKYKFRAGTQWIYRVEQRVAINTMSEAMANQGRIRDLLIGADVERFRLLFAVDNAYSDGDGLVRIQPIPDKGKTSAVLTTESNDAPTTYQDFEMAPVYMRLNPDGSEVFGSIPKYFPMDGTGGEVMTSDLYAIFPLPVLPTSPQRPGGTPWRSNFQVSAVDLAKAAELTAITTKGGIVARGELIGVEWEMGHPCARIRHTLEQRTPKIPNLPPESRVLSATKVEEDIYFALDLGTVVKMTREYTIDTKQAVQSAGGGAGGRTGAPGAPGGSGPAIGGPAGVGGGSGPGRGQIDIHKGGAGSTGIKQGGGRFGGQGGGRPGQGPGAGIAGAGTPPGGQGRGATQGRATSRIVRVSVQLTFTLEK